MDLRTVKEDLLGGNYETPLEFAKDMKLIFTNSRNYNTNKRSRVSKKRLSNRLLLFVERLSFMLLLSIDILYDNKIISHV